MNNNKSHSCCYNHSHCSENKVTQEMIDDWVKEQKRMYAEGKLSENQIKQLEGIKGWTWK